jgi:nitrogen regulatory protein PII
MRLVVAQLKPSQLEAVRQALAAVQVTRLTVCDAHGYPGQGRGTPLVQETLMQIAVNEDFLGRTVDTIRAALAAGGAEGDAGRIFVLPMIDAVQLYREVRGAEAV